MAAASVDMKINILKKSMGTFSVWLDGCDKLIKELPQELEKSDSTHLRDLALKYKVCAVYIALVWLVNAIVF